jgi:hypothetical protein
MLGDGFASVAIRCKAFDINIGVDRCISHNLFFDFQRFLGWNPIESPYEGKLVGKTQTVMFPSALQDALNIIGRKWRL